MDWLVQRRFVGWAGKSRTFFCNRTTDVHFFSSSPSYFFEVAASKLSPMLASARRAAAAFGRLFEERYAMMDLCLEGQRQTG